MAKYTREQRQRAVELYVKYEGCAADVIRELGYPSREALRMWHRDWLDEQETGVSSQRGERYARYTEEQKRAAVDHYLTHGRRASRTMRQMGYCFASMFVRQVRQCFSAVWADGFPRCRHRFPVM